jgi:hypothetical protein
MSFTVNTVTMIVFAASAPKVLAFFELAPAGANTGANCHEHKSAENILP